MNKLLPFLTIVLASCFNENDKPSVDVMKECLIKELGSSVKIAGYEHQDGVTKVIDGVKIYDAYFNAEVKFLSNAGGVFKVGDEYKLVKVSVQLMKTEKGWNCQEYDWSNAKLVKINKGSNEDLNNVSGQEFKTAISEPVSNTSNQRNTSNNYQKNANDNNYQEGSLLRFSQASERILSRSELVGFSNWELRIMRNEIYAKYGYIFKSEDLRNYFNQQSWYKPRYNDVSDKLTSIEKQNAVTIKSMEQSFHFSQYNFARIE
jgi:hypothetical protein